jgi:hypothetical protein
MPARRFPVSGFPPPAANAIERANRIGKDFIDGRIAKNNTGEKHDRSAGKASQGLARNGIDQA